VSQLLIRSVRGRPGSANPSRCVRLVTTAAADRSFTKRLDPLSVGLSRLKRQLNSRRVRPPADNAGYRYGNGALFLVVCDDPKHREQTGSGRLGAIGLLHIG